MPTPRSHRRARLAALLSVVLAVTGFQLLLAPQAAQAAGPGLVIQEVYGAGGNNGAVYNADYVELYNSSDTAVPLAGKYIHYKSASGGSGGAPFPLSGSVAPGGHYLIQMSAVGANGAALPTPDAGPAGFSVAAAGGQIFLQTSSSVIAVTGNTVGTPGVIDMVGASGSTSFETAATGSATTTASLNRNPSGGDTDNNSVDFSTAAPTPQNAGPAPLSLTNPGTQNNNINDSVSVGLVASGGTPPYTYSAAGLPAGLSIDSGTGVISGTTTTTGSSSVTATVTDSAGSPATDSKTFTWNVSDPSVLRTISEIQGTGAASPLAGQTVLTEGKVTASYPTGGLSGFYIQSTTDDPDASDALFVFGSGSFSAFPSIGDSVRVTGAISEFNGLTEMTISSNGALSTIGDLGTVPVKTTIPGTDCALPGGSCLTGAALDAAREQVEGEAFQPTDPWTLTDVYDGGPAYNPPNGTNSTSNFGEIGVAADSSTALIAPTELIDAQDTAGIGARTAYNNAHRIIMDDGSSTNYTTTTGQPFPWMSATSIPRVGAALTFPAPIVFTWGFGAWRIEPTTQVVGAPSATQPQFTNTRIGNEAPAEVGGQVKLATFNVLNFFPTTGEEYVAMGGGNVCTYFTDRDGNRVTTNNCGNPSATSGNGPRGAANDANLQRQRDKIVAAINTANADIVSLEELENSVKFGKDRDFAIQALVTALNVDHPGKWDYAPSPAPADLPTLDEQDVIRTGFIYQPAKVSLVGASKVLVDSAPFSNAREPLAQAFKKAGDPDSAAFAVIVNHFKSKGSGVDDGTGQGNANPDRIAQADALAAFASQFQADRGIDKVFLVGDFNAYSHEDPIEHLEAAGYTPVDSTDDPNEETYNFDGMLGSLDHVLANDAALPMVTGADVWTINGYESVYYEYSRFNYNITNLYDSGPFRSSDHSPEIVGLDTTPEPADTTTVADDVTVAYGQPVPVLVTVTGGESTPTGTVTLLQGGTPIGTGTLGADGTTTITVAATTFPVGDTPLVAVYDGDTTHGGSQDALTVTTTKATATVDAPDVNTPAGVPGTVTVTVTADGVTPTGSVAIKNGTTTIASGSLSGGSATVTLPVVADGTVLTAAYSGDANVAEGSDTFTVRVAKPAPTVSAGDVSLQYGRTATVTVTVTGTGGTPTGVVTITSGGTELASGTLSKGKVKITLPARSLPAGVHTLTAEYGGDTRFGAGSDTFTATVTRATSTTNASISPAKPRQADPVTLNVQVRGSDNVEVTGQVSVTVDGSVSSATLVDGRVSLDLGTFGKGTHKVTVAYLGSPDVAGSQQSLSFKVS